MKDYSRSALKLPILFKWVDKIICVIASDSVSVHGVSRQTKRLPKGDSNLKVLR
ncbi:MAG: hypothetical protein AAFQ23_15290 [Cyanobacteria bacterium J06623_1]